VYGCRCAGQSLAVDVRRLQQSATVGKTRRSSNVPRRLTHVDTTTQRASLSGVVGRRDLPSRGLPVSQLPLKRCRIDSRPADLAGFIIHHGYVTDEDDDWNKENQRPDCSHKNTVAGRRPQADSSSSSSRCADRHEHSPANHFYHTLEPSADCRPPADRLTSPVYESIDDMVDVSAELGDRRRHQSKLACTSPCTCTERPQHDSKIHRIKKRVTFNVSMCTVLN